MSKAKNAALLAVAYAQAAFPNDAIGMSKYTIRNVLYIVGGDNYSEGTAKYIPKDELNKALGLPDGAGVFGYVRFDDGTYVLETCSNGLAVWGGADTVPELIGLVAPSGK